VIHFRGRDREEAAFWFCRNGLTAPSLIYQVSGGAVIKVLKWQHACLFHYGEAVPAVTVSAASGTSLAAPKKSSDRRDTG
jgi:hypothetical protein